MSHDHSHHHDHSHGHHHHHAAEPASELTFQDKLEKMITHWIRHNKDHAETYRQWAEKARGEHLESVAELLDSVVGQSERMDAALTSALEKLKSK